ncbi:hypothetical protein [Arthrobacter sp. I3]|uniref:hypothetical protein n=1 Tax=Arthrobacter sp. I3 TaxID=218158 RepID=UPI0004856CBA|nr:hypothetical protein [Arthrobacter sp. I3]
MIVVLVVLNVLAFALSFGAILWAWVSVKGDVARNSEILNDLRTIDATYEPLLASTHDREGTYAARTDEYTRAGKFTFTFQDMHHMPELVKSMIFSHALSGLRSQVALVGLGLTLGTVANVWSLYV